METLRYVVLANGLLAVVSVVSTNGSSGDTGGLHYYDKEFPEALHKVVKEDEATVAESNSKHKLDFLIEEENKKFKELGSESSTFSREFFKNKSI